mgnify:CR=1 FL=1
MTGYTVHTGSTEKFATGWDLIFSGSRAGKGVGKKKAVARKSTAKAAKGAKARTARKK